ncbi:hypothetical protein GOQ27_12185 [Clostridium sp. D2Q-11]|uniref:Uncharacterized protein n=1 Tax=Anaeromonas frigoriresistens TaxID=2683708 RepID=A0A942Z9V6_9FIRM|nr:hypothetical protein [Anaeromonas frigoriresistens]MBS4539225.1 hypothetical protein [Anaeromonas frigoriresistens]
MDFNLQFKIIFGIIVIIILGSIQYTLNKMLYELRKIIRYLSSVDDD